MDLQRLLYGGTDGKPGIQRGVGILKNHLNFTPEGLEPFPLQVTDIRIVKKNGPLGWFLKTYQDFTRCRLARSAFTGQTQDLPWGNLQGNSVNGPDETLFVLQDGRNPA